MFALLTTRIYCCNAGHHVIHRTLTTSKLKEYYDALNVERTSTPKEIKASFLKLSKVYHPDNKLTGSHIKFVKLKEAYDAIKDGPPSTNSTSSSSAYQQRQQEQDLSHQAYARYRNQTRDYESPPYGESRYGFGGPYANSSKPWEEMLRDREYRKQQRGFANRAGKPLASLTLLLSAISWIVIYSSALLMWEYNDNVKDSYTKNRTKHRDEYMAFDSYLHRREEARRARRAQFNEYKPSEEKKPIGDTNPVNNSKIPETTSEPVASNKEEPLVTPSF